MVIITGALALYLALALGVAGDFIAWIASCGGVGGSIACGVCLFAERRARRRCVPWADPLPIPANRYLWTGAVAGVVVGLALGIVDVFL